MHRVLLDVISPASSRVLIGRPPCRDRRWLRLAVDFPKDVFIMASILNLLPGWSHCIVARLIPARRRILKSIRLADDTVARAGRQHAAVKEARARGEQVEEEDTLLNWMLDRRSPNECLPSAMGALQCALTLAAIHTTSMTALHLIHDLCEHPEWLPVLRDEVDSLADELGGPSEKPMATTEEWCDRLEKLDSFLVESQLRNPMTRMAKQDMRLYDGTRVRSGTVLAFAACEPDEPFDPMRSYRLRRASWPDQRDGHRAGAAHRANLTFGYGSQACPGRHFAVAEVKLVVARLLLEFDFKFLPRQSRPWTFDLNEMVLVNPWAKMLMRRRRTTRRTR
ncbi:hypothetical protein L249_1273 [Ophiocordyceps polyrhachis-furcata BCC 54312]|uniref:Cytochrome P450 n=1 Tax=Ophiocordyceps polyrhachis-furcata BCC 54312 TaxID=1330021 RepID=A0A367LE95_9HYPO|nr:hypothetical protein L249_1273 [Ophiocordyceps polyrhachis-furcata BCC 54312]